MSSYPNSYFLPDCAMNMKPALFSPPSTLKRKFDDDDDSQEFQPRKHNRKQEKLHSSNKHPNSTTNTIEKNVGMITMEDCTSEDSEDDESTDMGLPRLHMCRELSQRLRIEPVPITNGSTDAWVEKQVDDRVMALLPWKPLPCDLVREQALSSPTKEQDLNMNLINGFPSRNIVSKLPVNMTSDLKSPDDDEPEDMEIL